MEKKFQFVEDLEKEIEIPSKGILTRKIHQSDNAKVVLFGFDAGQELSEHTAGVPVLLQGLKGEMKISMNNETLAVKKGAWIHMEAHLPHTVLAVTPSVMILVLLTC